LTVFETECLAIVHSLLTRLFTPSASKLTTSHPDFEQPKGVFVTLKKNGLLRGCIGQMTSSRPLKETLARMVRAAAFDDPRFPPLQENELSLITFSVTLLDPLVPYVPSQFEWGIHGFWVENARTSGVLLPQVAVENEWTQHEFLHHTFQKADIEDHEIDTAKVMMFRAVELTSTEYMR